MQERVRPRDPAVDPRPSLADRRPAPVAHPIDTLAQLQRTAGNGAVSLLVQRVRDVAQREPATALPPLTEDFSPDEEEWISEVWQNPGIQLMFQAYGELPTPVLARVREVVNDNGSVSTTTEGVTHNEPEPGQPDIEITDATYGETMVVEPPGQGQREATSEEEFKATLIHELFHFVENNTKSVDPESIATPETLRAILAEPRLEGLPAFAFGWINRGGDAAYLGHVSVVPISTGPLTSWVPTGSPEAKAKKDKAYEASPDPRTLEEDLATSIAMYLTGPALRAHMLEKYPRRFALVGSYFNRLVEAVRGPSG